MQKCQEDLKNTLEEKINTMEEEIEKVIEPAVERMEEMPQRVEDLENKLPACVKRRMKTNLCLLLQYLYLLHRCH
ncbi:hypothetical protein TNCV_3876441 [Trichonephila clavipes]|uniref:Uncharacterized protein n=1 Tax=Trichonephila clavipes TaxID=2585209 RepID=A0A8X6ST06_TRICX|nr:hypothetical protein TNCV_3876441 [Trichonephila clavipes]